MDQKEQWEAVRKAAAEALGRLRFSRGDWEDVRIAIDEIQHIEQLAIEALEGAP